MHTTYTCTCVRLCVRSKCVHARVYYISRTFISVLHLDTREQVEECICIDLFLLGTLIMKIVSIMYDRGLVLLTLHRNCVNTLQYAMSVYTIHWASCTEHYTEYSVHCTVYIVQCTMVHVLRVQYKY